jgi:HlyD family secretion protein
MKMKKKSLIIIAAIVVVVIVVIVNLSSSGKKTTPVEAETATRNDIAQEVSASGWIQPKTRVNITAEVNAKIIGIFVKEGETVMKGQFLVQLDTVQLQKDVDQSRYSLNEMEARTEAAKSSFLQAEEEHSRQKQLFEKKLTSETAVKNSEYTYLSSKYNYEAMLSQTRQGRAGYEKALDNLSKTRIMAPMDGAVTFLDAEVGEIASAQTAFTQGKTLMTVSNLNSFEAEVDVDETEVAKVKLGQTARIEVDAFPDSMFQGEVVEIGNTAVKTNVGSTDQSTNFKVKVLFVENNEFIKPGMSATVDIVTDVRNQTLTVPYGAIVMRPKDADSLAGKTGQPQETGGVQAAQHEVSLSESAAKGKKEKEVKGVFMIKEGKAKFMPIETGIADQKNIEIISGVAEKDTVVTGPFKTLRTLKNGDEVKVEKKFNMETPK